MSKKQARKLQERKNSIIRLFKKGQSLAALEALTELQEKSVSDAELYYLEGMIRAALFAYADARACFEKALRLQPRYPECVFELGIIQITLCRFNRARKYFQASRAKGYRTAEANDYLSQIDKVARQKDVTLSACMIVKNEEKRLPTCLKSIAAVADEIIVVDTGSDDRTPEIATNFGAKVIDFEWKKNFADARNCANAHATGDWILQLDADEELFPEDQQKVRELIHQDTCEGAYVALHNRVSSSFGESQPSIHYLVRLYKNRPDFYFKGDIHETLRITGEVIPVDINLLHHGYNLDSSFMESKRRRNAQILYRKYEEDPGNATTLFYLAMMHLGNREFDVSESFALKALPLLDPGDLKTQHLYLMLMNNLGLIASERGHQDEVKKYCTEAIRINENYLDPYFFLGISHFADGDLEGARKIFSEYVRRNRQQADRPIFNLFGTSGDTYLYQVMHFLGKIHRKQGDHDEAKKWMLQAVEVNPDFWIGLVDLAYIAMDERDLQQAVEYFDRAIKLARSSPGVKKSNKQLWFDFTNAVKAYMKVLRLLRAGDEAQVESEAASQ